MSLDDVRNSLHAEMLEKDPSDLTDVEWLVMARAQEAAEARAAAREDAELYAFESVEGEEARWSYRMRRRARDIPGVHYARD